jgi:hypothetical protein
MAEMGQTRTSRLSTPLLHWSSLISKQPTRSAETPSLTHSVYVERIGSTQ